MVFENKKWPLGIRNRILIFTFIVTLIPSLGLGWLFYSQTQQLLWEKVELELQNTIKQAEQEVELWVKKSSFNISVFSNSFIITENLQQWLNKNVNQQVSPESIAMHVRKMADYLGLVQAEFSEYRRLILLDTQGKIITQTSDVEDPFSLPSDWEQQLEQNHVIISDVKQGKEVHSPLLSITVPVLSDTNRRIGLLATELNLNGVKSLLESVSVPEHANLLLLKASGMAFYSRLSKAQQLTMPHLNGNQLTTLLNKPMQFSIYTNTDGNNVIGINTKAHNFPWYIVVEKNYDQAFAEINALKKRIFIIIIVLVTIFSTIAYLVSQSILCPLKQLITGASQVAAGDLKTELPVNKNDELGFAISVFNDMVQRLKKTHDEKEKMLREDPLTGLYNRRHMMEILNQQIQRYQRNSVPFSVFMADLDHFKQINDTYGHQAGDAILAEVGKIFQKTLRTIDAAGRYGGEEFIIVLEDSGEHEALQTAERLRKAIDDTDITFENRTIHFTTSIGIATFSSSNDSRDDLIDKADKALYQAKMNGRNQVYSFDPNIIVLTSNRT